MLSREQLLSRVWGLDFDAGSNVAEVYVRYRHAKIGADRIKTVRAMGYGLVWRPMPATYRLPSPGVYMPGELRTGSGE